MNLSAIGLKLIKDFEGLRLESYECSAGVWTIGYGHTGSDVKEGQLLTENQAETLLQLDLHHFERGVREMVKVPINQYQFDALVSLAFNIGLGALSRSTLIKLLNDRTDKKIVAAEFKKWNKVNGKVNAGLKRRRDAEYELYLRKVRKPALAASIIAKKDTWLKLRPEQSSDLEPEQKVFVPKGAAHEWVLIMMLPGEKHLVVHLAADPDTEYYIWQDDWKIINDPAPKPVEEAKLQPLVLDTPYYSQRDNPRDPMRTCYSSACAMLLSSLIPGAIKGDEEYIETVFSIGDTTEAWVQLEALEAYGVEAEFRQNLGFSDIDSLLSEGIPVPVGILHHGPVSKPSGGGHWIVIIGRTSDNAAYIVHDPFGDLDLVNGGYLSSNGKALRYSKKNLGPRWMVEGAGTGWGIVAK